MKQRLRNCRRTRAITESGSHGEHLQRDLDNLQSDMLALAGLVEGAIHKAILALQDARCRTWPRGHRRRRRRSTTRKTTSTRSV